MSINYTKCLRDVLPPLISISVVSHCQSKMVAKLMDDLESLEVQNFEVIVTCNLPEESNCYLGRKYPVKIIHNVRAMGFGANHNQAFDKAQGKYFAVVNPDIRLNSMFSFEPLIAVLIDPSTAAVGPVVISNRGSIEDSVRRFPTVRRLARRVIFRDRQNDYTWHEEPIVVDWVAGMFVLFASEHFKKVCGFDAKRFFMYLEDADICYRLAKLGLRTKLQPAVQVMHIAQRASRRNIQHLRWHAVSAFRFLFGI